MNDYLVSEITEKTAKWAETRSDLALALVGSYTWGEAKPDSDIDLMVITSNTDLFRQNHQCMNQINWEFINFKVQKSKI